MVDTSAQNSKPGVLSAAELRARGFALCRPDPGKKNPTYRRWGTYSLGSDDFGPDDLYGVICGPLSDLNRPGHALIIIDLDDADALAKADGILPPTGLEEGKPEKPRDHRYYLVPLDSIPSWAHSPADQSARAAKKAKGHAGPWKKQFQHGETKACVIDFLGTGGQAVCPSPGSPRCWQGGVPGDAAVVPFETLWNGVCRLAKVCGCNIPPVNGHARHHDGGPCAHRLVVKADAPGDPVARARAYVAKRSASVSGQGGHIALWRVALDLVRGFALTVEQARPLIEDFNRRCEPPWSDKELSHKLNDADTKSRLTPLTS
jgi:hypothetical protein